jgi:hypothetical protein
MAKNKITTCSYFIKRLRDSGYVADKLFSEFGQQDPRSWTAIIDPGVSSVFVTCYNNHNNLGEEYFEIYDGGQFVPNNFKIKTSSIEVVIEYLVKFGVNNKASTYAIA